MMADPLRGVVQMIEAANDRLTRSLEETRTSWGDRTRSDFDGRFVNDVNQAARQALAEAKQIADAVRSDISKLDQV